MQYTLNIFFNLFCFIFSFVFMEFIAWWTHKYLMHGPLWVLHKSHHRPRQGKFELNDIFALMFGLPAILFIILGLLNNVIWLFAIGAGISVYGFAYFLVHDVYVHRRLKILDKLKSSYLNKIRQLHNIHHGKNTKHGTVNFGFLWIGWGK